MSSTTVTTWTCDNCPLLAGGKRPDDWLAISLTLYNELEDVEIVSKRYDFCSIYCLQEWMGRYSIFDVHVQ